MPACVSLSSETTGRILCWSQGTPVLAILGLTRSTHCLVQVRGGGVVGVHSPSSSRVPGLALPPDMCANDGDFLVVLNKSKMCPLPNMLSPAYVHRVVSHRLAKLRSSVPASRKYVSSLPFT